MYHVLDILVILCHCLDARGHMSYHRSTDSWVNILGDNGDSGFGETLNFFTDLENKASFILEAINLDTEALSYRS